MEFQFLHSQVVCSQVLSSLSISFNRCPKHRIQYYFKKVLFSKPFYFRNSDGWLDFFTIFLSTEVNFCALDQHDYEHECLDMERVICVQMSS